ncbi:DUF883 family protein [Marinomonas algicola]|jgi:ElaB/YqjD/DUF883 family membrane-anchored ribosome-binding protein|uniref:DUF883 family protein n=1 Tax=Marinomonas algicola TaxID=2773454 RepID=UPI00174E69FA|nr:hypothetical protein [Marinomonas algicola]
MSTATQTKSTQAKQTKRDNAHETIDKAADSAHKGVDKAAETSAKGEQKVQEVTQQISQQAHELADTAKQQSEKVTQAVSSYAKENPVKSVGIAFLAGALVAGLFCKKK